MGLTAENIAAKYNISRVEQDELGLLSHQRARAAINQGLFREEIVPVNIPQKKGEVVVFDTDERPMDTSLEKMAKLPPVFKKDGTVTAGNASGIYASGGVDPAYMGLGPIPAVKKALERAGIGVKDLDVIELNEAFASQAVACMRELGLSTDNTNVRGSGVSLGHPIGCTGARLVVTILHEMKRQDSHLGLVTMCIGGGQGMAMVIER